MVDQSGVDQDVLEVLRFLIAKGRAVIGVDSRMSDQLSNEWVLAVLGEEGCKVLRSFWSSEVEVDEC